MVGYVRKIIEIQLGVKPIGFKEFQTMKRLLQEMKEESIQRINRIPRSTVAAFDQIENSQDLMDAYTSQVINESWWNAVPKDNLKVYSIQYHKRTLVAYHEWARAVLALAINKLFCIALQPFLKNIKSELWGDVRKLYSFS